MVAVSVEAFPDFAPCPRAGLTITGLTVGESVVSVWRTADGERSSVRGARRKVMNDADYIMDYDVPTGRPVSYEVEVVSGPYGPDRVTSSAVTVDTTQGCIMDPLVPQSAVAIVPPTSWDGGPTFAAAAMSSLEYASEVSVYKILGSDKPMALFGQRMAAAGIDLSMITDAAEENSRLRKLFMSTGQLLVRLPLSWSSSVPGTCFAAVASVVEKPVEHGDEGALTVWELSGDTVAAPQIRVLTAEFTYGDVQLLMSTYGQKQDAMAGGTYLDDLKSPFG